MFKLTESDNTIRTLSEVSVEGYETIPANATVPKGHRLWATYEAWLAQGNEPEPYESKSDVAAKIPALRYAEEEKGVTLNGVRYAGDESNRQALREAVDMATKAGRTVFETWKDSDGNYLPNHPVSEVDQALDALFQRRSDLIGLEGKYVKQVLAGEITDLSTLTWETI